jgi:hypothetical protein
VCFVLAFVLGRKQQLGTTAQDDESSEDE